MLLNTASTSQEEEPVAASQTLAAQHFITNMSLDTWEACAAFLSKQDIASFAQVDQACRGLALSLSDEQQPRFFLHKMLSDIFSEAHSLVPNQLLMSSFARIRTLTVNCKEMNHHTDTDDQHCYVLVGKSAKILSFSALKAFLARAAVNLTRIEFTPPTYKYLEESETIIELKKMKALSLVRTFLEEERSSDTSSLFANAVLQETIVETSYIASRDAAPILFAKVDALVCPFLPANRENLAANLFQRVQYLNVEQFDLKAVSDPEYRMRLPQLRHLVLAQTSNLHLVCTLLKTPQLTSLTILSATITSNNEGRLAQKGSLAALTRLRNLELTLKAKTLNDAVGVLEQLPASLETLALDIQISEEAASKNVSTVELPALLREATIVSDDSSAFPLFLFKKLRPKQQRSITFSTRSGDSVPYSFGQLDDTCTSLALLSRTKQWPFIEALKVSGLQQLNVHARISVMNIKDVRKKFHKRTTKLNKISVRNTAAFTAQNKSIDAGEESFSGTLFSQTLEHICLGKLWLGTGAAEFLRLMAALCESVERHEIRLRSWHVSLDSWESNVSIEGLDEKFCALNHRLQTAISGAYKRVDN